MSTEIVTDAKSSILVAHPTIVIGVPCYNEDAFLMRTLDSIARQTWQDFEVLISDNASSDATGDLARDYCDKDPRFHYHCQATNIGSAGNFNFLRDRTDSRYLLWVGAHDRLDPTMLAHHLAVLEARPEVSVSQSAHAWIDVHDRFVERVEDGDLDFGGADDVRRYLRSIGQNRHNIGANSVLRRAMLGDVRFQNVVGTDRILLSHLAYRGPFANSAKTLYFRRTFDARTEENDYMARLVGNPNATKDWSAFAAEYDRDLAGLLGESAGSAPARRALALRLRYYLPVEQASFLTQVLWTLRRAHKWLGLAAIARMVASWRRLAKTS